MHPRRIPALLLMTLAFHCAGAPAQQQGLAKPNLVLQEVVAGMPRGEKQEVRVLTASFQPGDKTVFHTHRSPVTVYILQGEFTLELEGRAPVTVKAGKPMSNPRT